MFEVRWSLRTREANCWIWIGIPLTKVYYIQGLKGARHMTGITCTLYALTDGVSAICLLFPTAAHRMGTVVHQAPRISNRCGRIERLVRGDIWLAMDPCVNHASQTTEQIKPWATICSISDIPRWCPSGEQVVPMWCPGGAQVVPIATIITNFLLPVINLRLWCVY